MATYSELVTLINAYINENGVQAITGRILNGVLNEMVDQLGSGFPIMGSAVPTDNPGTPDSPRAWFASEPGIYTNFGGIVIEEGELALLIYDNGWYKTDIGQGGDPNAVKYTEQELTDAQKAQARANIESISANDLEEGVEEINLGPNVQYVVQSLSDNQKNQARENIGAASSAALNGKQDALVSGTNIKTINGESLLGMGNISTVEDVDDALSGTSSNPVQNKVVTAAINSKQMTLVSGSNIKTINGDSILGPGDIIVQGTDPNAVKFVAQTITDAQKEQARENISAASSADLALLEAAVRAFNAGDYVIATTLPTASASTAGHIYLIGPDAHSEYERWITKESGGTYSWVSLGSTELDLDTYATKTEIGQVEHNAMLPLMTEIDTPALTNSSYWNLSSNGALRYVASGAAKSTNPIFCKKGTIVLTDQNTQFSPGMSFITKVSSTNEGIECLVPGDNSTQKKYWYAVEEDCYICISVLSNQVDKVRIIPSGGLEYLLDYIRDKHDNLIRISDNPLEHIIRDCGYGSVIHHWGIVGDSLSSGEIHIRNAGGSSTYIDYYEYSWGQRFAKMINAISCYNFSNGGQTAKGWIEGTVDGSSNIVHGDGYIGGVGGGGWPLAKTAGYKKQAYIIALGVNDHSESYPTGSVSTDIGTYDSTTDTDTNADSFVGYYAGIIQRLRSIQPDAKIFCVTMPNNTFPDESAAIADIVGYFSALYSGDVYLIDLSAYLPIKWDGDYMYNSHGSAQGYQYIAYAVNTYIDWIIRNNADDFKTMPLVNVKD